MTKLDQALTERAEVSVYVDALFRKSPLAIRQYMGYASDRYHRKEDVSLDQQAKDLMVAQRALTENDFSLHSMARGVLNAMVTKYPALHENLATHPQGSGKAPSGSLRCGLD